MPKGKLIDCKGISLNKKRGRWEIQIIFKNKRHYLGSSTDKGEARAIWEKGRDFYYGTDKVIDLEGEEWRSEIRIGNELFYFGNFSDPQLASDRYMEGLLELGLVEDYNYIRKMLSKNN